MTHSVNRETDWASSSYTNGWVYASGSFWFENLIWNEEPSPSVSSERRHRLAWRLKAKLQNDTELAVKEKRAFIKRPHSYSGSSVLVPEEANLKENFLRFLNYYHLLRADKRQTNVFGQKMKQFNPSINSIYKSISLLYTICTQTYKQLIFPHGFIHRLNNSTLTKHITDILQRCCSANVLKLYHAVDLQMPYNASFNGFFLTFVWILC